ncbi:MAG: cytochrome c [Gammaproteobacteria bacterium]|nr:cytochrome c [Gammaproteobacteria bacterium]
MKFKLGRMKIAIACLAVVTTAAFGWRLAVAQQTGNTSFVPLATSINALMVALVDHSAHELWDAGYQETMTGRDWQIIEQHAIQLVAAGTLTSLGGTGAADRGWAVSPAWQTLSQDMTDAALAALAAVQDHDQMALQAAGSDLVDACEGCHDQFKPDSPTEGILHVPHYD